MDLNVAVPVATGGAGTPATGGAGTDATCAIPATFACKLEEATAVCSSNRARFAALRAAPPVYKRTTIIEGAIKPGGAVFSVSEEVKETPVSALLDAWRGPPPGGITPAFDFFNDRVNYAAGTWAELEALNAAMFPVLDKYDALHVESPKVVAASTAIVGNYRAIAAALAAMEEQVAGAGGPSVVPAVQEECADIAARLAAVASKHGAVIRPMPVPVPAVVEAATAAATGGAAAPALPAAAPASGSVGAGTPVASAPWLAALSALKALGATTAHVAFLEAQLASSGIVAPALELLFQATVDGTARADVMRKCKGKGPALVIGREATRGWLFGGFMDCGISDEGNERFASGDIGVPAPQSFLFTLTNPHGLPPTALRRGAHRCGVWRGGGYSLFWNGYALTADDDVLQWGASKDVNGCYQACEPHHGCTFTGVKGWTASEVLVFRV